MHSLQKTLLDWRRAPLFATSPDWRRLWPWLALGILAGAIAVPLGLLVYWVANNAFTLVQQGAITRFAPTPGSPAYAARAARRTAREA